MFVIRQTYARHRNKTTRPRPDQNGNSNANSTSPEQHIVSNQGVAPQRLGTLPAKMTNL